MSYSHFYFDNMVMCDDLVVTSPNIARRRYLN